MVMHKAINQPARAKVLFVEDEEALSDIYATKLSMEGYDVFTAKDGVEGMDLALHDNPDLILLDVILPKKDGFEVLAEIKKNQNLKAIPVLMLSNLGQDYEVKRGMKLGALKFLIKSDFTPSQVTKEVNEIIKSNKK